MSQTDKRMDTARAAVALRLAGASVVDIADGLGIASADQARQLIEAALGQMGVDPDDRNRLRTEASLRLERLLKGVWQKAISPTDPEHLQAVKVAMSLVDRMARLHGLDAPAEIIVHNPTAAEIDAWVAEMNATATAELRALEANVVDVEATDVPQLDPVQ